MTQIADQERPLLEADQGRRERDGHADDHAEEEDLDDGSEDGASAGLEDRAPSCGTGRLIGNNPQNGAAHKGVEDEGGVGVLTPNGAGGARPPAGTRGR